METESGIGKSEITGKDTESVVSALGESEMAGKITEFVILETENELLVSEVQSSFSDMVSLMVGLLVEAWIS